MSYKRRQPASKPWEGSLIAKQHESGKLTARERLELLFDSGTFQELDIFVRHRCTDFGMPEIEIPADGVITGFGKVNGRVVFAYSQDFTARAGTLGEMHAQKICKVMDLALKTGAPLVGCNYPSPGDASPDHSGFRDA